MTVFTQNRPLAYIIAHFRAHALTSFSSVSFSASLSVGGLGRPLTYRWRLIAPSGASLPQPYASSAPDTSTSVDFVVDAAYVAALPNVTVELTVSNWLGNSGRLTQAVLLFTSPQPYLTLLAPPNLDISPRHAYSLTASVTLADCLHPKPPLSDFAIAWTQRLGPPSSAITPYMLSLDTLQIPAYSFPAFPDPAVVQFCAQLIQRREPSLQPVNTPLVCATLRLVTLAPEARLAGGDVLVSLASLVNSSGAAVVLDGTGSTNPNRRPGSSGELSGCRTRWICLAPSGVDCLADAAVAPESLSLTLAVPNYAIKAKGVYAFSLELTCGALSSSAVRSVTVQVGKVVPVTLTTRALNTARLSPLDLLSVSMTLPYIYEGQGLGVPVYKWSVFQGAVADDAALVLLPDEVDVAGAVLTLPPEALLPGLDYVVRGVVKLPVLRLLAGESLTGETAMQITTKNPPVGGECRIDSLTGSAFSTAFTFTSEGFYTEENPIMYKWSLRDPYSRMVAGTSGGQVRYIDLVSYQLLNTFVSALPSGYEDPITGNTTVRAYVADSSGYAAFCDLSISLRGPVPLPANQSLAVLDNLLSSAVQSTSSMDLSTLASSTLLAIAYIGNISATLEPSTMAGKRDEVFSLLVTQLSRSANATANVDQSFYAGAMQRASQLVTGPSVVTPALIKGSMDYISTMFELARFEVLHVGALSNNE